MDGVIFFSSADGNSLTSYNGSEVDGVLKFDPSRNDYAEGISIL